MKKVGILLSHMGIGGNQRSASNISFALADKYEVFIIPFDSSNIAFKYAGEICDVNVPATNNNIKKIFNSFLRIIRIQKIIKEKQLNVIYCFTSHTNIISYFSFKKVRKIVSCRDAGNLLIHHRKFNRMLTTADLMIFNSYYMENFYLKIYPNDKRKTVVLNNAIDLSKINDLKTEPVELEFKMFLRDHFVIVATGRFCKEKGFNNLLRSFELLKKKSIKARIVFIGSGELETKLKQMARNSDYEEDILFLGYRNNPYKYITLCDVFVLSSITEGFPNVIIEAMACQLPIVATDCKSGPNEVLSSKFNYSLELKKPFKAEYGILTPEIRESSSYKYEKYNESEINLSNAIYELYINDELREQYKNRSIIRASHFGLDVVKNKLIEIL